MPNIPTRLNNPGDLKNPSTGQFEQFNDPQSGFSALKSDLQGKITGNTRTGLNGKSTLQQFASTWAPDSDGNDSTGYAKKLAAKLGVSTDTPIGDLSSRLDDFASAIADNEGYQGQRVLGSTQTASPVSSEPQSTQLSTSDFASKIKAKYPQYQSVDDNTLVQAILKKYPQYQSVVSAQMSQGPSQSSPSATPKNQSFSEAVASLPGGTPTENTGGLGDTVKSGLSGLIGTKKNDSLYGKVLDNNLTKGLVAGADALTFGGTSQLSNEIGSGLAGVGEKIKGLFGGKDNSQYVPEPSMANTVTGAGKVLAGVGSLAAGSFLGPALSTTSELKVAPTLTQKLMGVSPEAFDALGNGEKMALIKEAAQVANPGQANILNRALSQLQPLVDSEEGVGPTALRGILNKIGGGGLKLFKGLMKSAVPIATGYGARDIQDHIIKGQ